MIFGLLLPLKMSVSKKVINNHYFRLYPAPCLSFRRFCSLFPIPFIYRRFSGFLRKKNSPKPSQKKRKKDQKRNEKNQKQPSENSRKRHHQNYRRPIENQQPQSVKIKSNPRQSRKNRGTANLKTVKYHTEAPELLACLGNYFFLIFFITE